MLILDIDAAHNLVTALSSKGMDVRWDNYDIVFWKPTHHGFTHKHGAFRNNRWGMESRIRVTRDGTWKVPEKNVRFTR